MIGSGALSSSGFHLRPAIVGDAAVGDAAVGDAADDAEAIRVVQNRCFPDPWSRADIGAQLALSGAVAVVAEAVPDAAREGGGGDWAGIAGYAFGQCIADEVELRSIAVVPERRREGLGHDVLAAFLEIGRGVGGRCVFLEVAADDPAAIALYLSFGFSCIGKRTGYYRVGRTIPVDALVMKLYQI